MRIPDDQVQWYEKMAFEGSVTKDLAENLIVERSKVEALKTVLREARSTIDGLADQQAMGDDWYRTTLGKIDAVLS